MARESGWPVYHVFFRRGPKSIYTGYTFALRAPVSREAREDALARVVELEAEEVEGRPQWIDCDTIRLVEHPHAVNMCRGLPALVGDLVGRMWMVLDKPAIGAEKLLTPSEPYGG